MGCSKSTQTKNSIKTTFTVRASSFIQRNTSQFLKFYTPQSILGSGAFSQVKLCLCKRTNQLRAVKFIHKAGLHKQQLDPEDLISQVTVLKQLDHPHILRCYQIFEDNIRYYLATEYCQGGSLLKELVKRKSFSQADAGEIMFQLLSAVAYCHDHTVIHRDLKPENILLENSGDILHIKVADFGSSVLLDPNKYAAGCFGSPYYLAPEVLEGSYDQKCDIWSCGVIMYVILTGLPPYRAKNSNMILTMVRESPLQIHPQDFPHLSPECLDLMGKLLQLKTYKRVSALQALSHPWIANYRMNWKTDLTQVFKNLNQFTMSSKLKDAVYIFIASQVVSHQDAKELQQAFEEIDINGDGKISREELIQVYKRTMVASEQDTLNEIQRIMTEIDSDQNGFIDYTQFTKICIDNKKHLSRENLENIFAMFDLDKNGAITASELREFFQGKEIYQQQVWKNMLDEADTDGNGELDLEEFINLMSSVQMISEVCKSGSQSLGESSFFSDILSEFGEDLEEVLKEMEKVLEDICEERSQIKKENENLRFQQRPAFRILRKKIQEEENKQNDLEREYQFLEVKFENNQKRLQDIQCILQGKNQKGRQKNICSY